MHMNLNSIKRWTIFVTMLIHVTLCGQIVNIVAEDERRAFLYYSMDLCDCEMTEVHCDSLGAAVLGFGCSYDISFAYSGGLHLYSFCPSLTSSSVRVDELQVGCNILGHSTPGARYPLFAMATDPTQPHPQLLTLAGEQLYFYDYSIDQFYTAGSFVTDTVESMTYVGKRLIGIWRNKLVEIDPLYPDQSKELFTLPCTKAELPPKSRFYTYLKVVSYPTTCGDWVVYLINFYPRAIGKIKRGFSRLDINTGELTYTCTPRTHYFFNSHGQTMLPDTLPCVELSLDPDLDDSAGKPPRDYEVSGQCPPFVLDIVDRDVLVRALGRDPDSIVLRLCDVVEDGAEYLTGGGEAHVRSSGKSGERLVLRSDGMAVDADFRRALSGVQYRYDSPCPVSGTRRVKILMYACNYLTDTSTVYIRIPELGCAGRDTALALCDDAGLINPEDLLGRKADKGGIWLPSGRAINPSMDSSTTLYYVVGRGVCPEDSARIDIEIGKTPVFDLGGDTVICTEEESFLLSVSREADSIRWSTGAQSTSIRIKQSGSYSVTLSNIPGCRYSDTIAIEFGRDTIVDMGTYSICEGDSVAYWGGYLKASGVYTDTFERKGTCDSILRIEIVKRKLPGFSLGKDTTLCGGGGVLELDPGIDARTYRWQDGTMERVYAAGKSGVYWVEVEDENGCRFRDSIRVVFSEDAQSDLGILRRCRGDSLRVGTEWITVPGSYALHLKSALGCDSLVRFEFQYYEGIGIPIMGDSLSCEGDTLTLRAAPGIVHRQWSTGDTTPQIEVHQSGKIRLEGRDKNGCSVVAEVHVRFEPPPIIDIVSRDERCAGAADGLILILPPGGGHPPFHYTINGSALDSTRVEDLAPGRYLVSVQDGLGCRSEEEVDIGAGAELVVDAGEDIELIRGDTTIVIRPKIRSAHPVQFEWEINGERRADSGVVLKIDTISSDLEVCVRIRDTSGCISEDCLQIRLLRTDDIFIPNVFSPNDDRINDRFKVFGVRGSAEVVFMTIYDRWGGRVYHQEHLRLNDDSRYWDGGYKGKKALPGVYVYQLLIGYADGRSTLRSGTITLVR